MQYSRVRALINKEAIIHNFKNIKKLIPDTTQFDVFLYADDFHNLKAAVKAVSSGERDGIFVKGGTVDLEVIKKAVYEKEIGLLPEKMQKPCEEAVCDS